MGRLLLAPLTRKWPCQKVLRCVTEISACLDYRSSYVCLLVVLPILFPWWTWLLYGVLWFHSLSCSHDELHHCMEYCDFSLSCFHDELDHCMESCVFTVYLVLMMNLIIVWILIKLPILLPWWTLSLYGASLLHYLPCWTWLLYGVDCHL